MNMMPCARPHSQTYEDNLIAATAAELKYAQDHQYTSYEGDDLQLVESPGDGLIPLKTYYSATLKDSLTTACAEGLAWAADPSNDYVFQQIEGYCYSTASPSASTELVTMWSTARTDTYLVASGSSHYDTAKSSGYSQNWYGICVCTHPLSIICSHLASGRCRWAMQKCTDAMCRS